MTWDRARRSSQDAGWEVGSHTRSHPRLSQVEDDAELADELEGSRRVCEERLGRPCQSIAYPYGDHDERVVAAAGRAGYRYGLTLPDAPALRARARLAARGDLPRGPRAPLPDEGVARAAGAAVVEALAGRLTAR